MVELRRRNGGPELIVVARQSVCNQVQTEFGSGKDGNDENNHKEDSGGDGDESMQD